MAEEEPRGAMGADLARPNRSAYRDLLAERNSRIFFGAAFVSSLGDWVGFVALQALIAVLYAANPRFALFGLGGLMMARLLPSLLFGPVAGVLADRYDRKRLMVFTDLARAVLFVFVAFSRNLSTLFVLTFFVETLALLFLSAKDATLPKVVAKRNLTEGNQLNLLLAYGTLPLGALLATAITTALVGFGVAPQQATVVVLLVDAGSFAVNAVLLSQLRLPDRSRARADAGEPAGLLNELRDGLKFINALPIVRSLILGVVGVFFGAGVVVTLGPVFVTEELNRPGTDWPQLMTAVGAGLVLGIVTVTRMTRRIRMEKLFPVSLAAAGAIAAVIAWVPNFATALGLGLVLGVAAGQAFVMGYTLLQQYTTDDVRSRTFAAFYTATRISLFTALGIAPFLASAISGSLLLNRRFYILSGIRITIFVGGLIALYSAIGALKGMYRALREEDDKHVRIQGKPVVKAQTGGVFVAFEGVEGSGKSTQVKALVATLTAEGRDVVVTREPGGPPVAERIRDVLLDPNAEGMNPRTEALLYAAARAEHVDRVVAPALEAGKVVVCDRYIDSSLAYQGFARQLGESDVFEINRWAVGGVLPDAVVLLDLDADQGLQRIRQRGQSGARRSGPRLVDGDWRRQQAPDRLESESVDFHRTVASGYRELARRDRERFVVVDADADPDAVARQVRKALHAWLPLPEAPDAAQRRPEAG